MAWTAANPVTVGNPTKKSDYDKLWDNAQYLQIATLAANLKLFGTAAGTNTEWAAGLKIGSLTRDTTAANGDVAYTGVGFKPAVIIFLAGHSTDAISVGFSDVTIDACVIVRTGKLTDTNAIYCGNTDGSASQTAVVKSMDADGFTLTWTKTGSPTGTDTVYYLAIR